LEARQLGWAGDHYTRWLSFIQPLRWKGSVEFRTQEIARLRVARLNQCHY
jgi:hypothetical protein